MPKLNDINKILVIGSGPIIIGQAAEFDYSGTQACLALKEEGYEVILVNSNPATIMTDTDIADKVYMEPLTLEYVAKIVRYERPDALLAGFGGQTALNLAMQLYKKGVLNECSARIIGTSIESIETAEDRALFKELCERIGEPVLNSYAAHNLSEVREYAEKIGYPVVLRPAFTLAGTGGGFAESEKELIPLAENALYLSPTSQVLVEKSIKGYKEIEYEVIRDANDTTITVCSMENVDPVGIHTGDSIVVAPSQTLSNKEYQMLRDSAIKIVKSLDIKGGCNVQFALDPYSFDYYLIEVNPRVSRSSALASKATGYPIARVAAKIAAGLNLDEIKLANTPASFEPAIDYVVAKIARFPFDKFPGADNALSTQMKATGEVMSIGRTIEESLLKAVRSTETGVFHLYKEKFDNMTTEELLDYIKDGTDDRLFAISEIIRRGIDVGVLNDITKIDLLFLYKIKNIVAMEITLKENKNDLNILYEAKRIGFSDKYIAKLWEMCEAEIFEMRSSNKIIPVYKMMDTCSAEFDSYVPYFFSTYEEENESVISGKKKIIVLGSGPIRIGQGVEFDYSTVHAVKTLKEEGYEAIVINNNPETVSTDYTVGDKLYFEPLTTEDVMNIISLENPYGVIVSLGGQTAINLAGSITSYGIKIIGTDNKAIEKAENRDLFEQTMNLLNLPQPEGYAVNSIEEGVKAAESIKYPVLVRPSFVLGGRAMQIVNSEESIRHYLKLAFDIDNNNPVLVDKYIQGKELEVDAVCDGENVFIPGILQHVERTGIHSGDSISVYPTFSISEKTKATIVDYTVKLGLAVGIKGLFNIQFIVDNDEKVYIIELNPRSSRTVPFLSKATGYSLADIATKVMIGKSLKQQGINYTLAPSKERWYVKVPSFSFSKLHGADSYLSPEMKSTGEAIGYDKSLNRALYKALQASGIKVSNYGTVFVTVADKDKKRALPIVKRFYDMGFNIEATEGTAKFLKENNIRTRALKKLSEGSDEILNSLRKGYVNYVINTKDVESVNQDTDGVMIRRCATENNIAIFTALETVEVLMDVLEEITIGISTIDAE